MLVFKFGGASVKDAEGIINLGDIVKQYTGRQLVIVVSAMGKTTNALEALTLAYVEQHDDMHAIYDDIKSYHFNIINRLFEPGHPVYDDIQNTFVEIDWMIEDEPHDDYDFIYDQIVSIGELVSTRIVSAYLNQIDIAGKWVDVRSYVHTDNTYREGVVDWQKTCEAVEQGIPPLLQKGIVVTQGFLGGTSENFTTTLGREGSDYTASIFASCLKAESVTTWKDVPGILNADPKLFADTVKFDELSYNEAIEMTYYGASVIHPKTIKPLQNADIPLLVKSFNQPGEPGTVIKEGVIPIFTRPVVIVKKDQVLISIATKDYSFITEDHLSGIFALLAKHHVKTNVLQTSALSFSVCIDLNAERLERLLNDLNQQFKVKYNDGLSLLTLRHYKAFSVEQYINGKEVLLEQQSRNTAQYVLR